MDTQGDAQGEIRHQMTGCMHYMRCSGGFELLWRRHTAPIGADGTPSKACTQLSLISWCTSRYLKQQAVPLPNHIKRRPVRHVVHARAEEEPAESFEAILARLGVSDLREAKVKDLSAICGRLGIARSGKDCLKSWLSTLRFRLSVIASEGVCCIACSGVTSLRTHRSEQGSHCNEDRGLLWGQCTVSQGLPKGC